MRVHLLGRFLDAPTKSNVFSKSHPKPIRQERKDRLAYLSSGCNRIVTIIISSRLALFRWVCVRQHLYSLSSSYVYWLSDLLSELVVYSHFHAYELLLYYVCRFYRLLFFLVNRLLCCLFCYSFDRAFHCIRLKVSASNQDQELLNLLWLEVLRFRWNYINPNMFWIARGFFGVLIVWLFGNT